MGLASGGKKISHEVFLASQTEDENQEEVFKRHNSVPVEKQKIMGGRDKAF